MADVQCLCFRMVGLDYLQTTMLLMILLFVVKTRFEESIGTRLCEERRIFSVKVLLLARSGQEVCIASWFELWLLLNDRLLNLLGSCSLQEPSCVADTALPIDLSLFYISAILRRGPRVWKVNGFAINHGLSHIAHESFRGGSEVLLELLIIL